MASNPVQHAAAKLAGLSANGNVPDPEALAAAYTRLKVARVEREMRLGMAEAAGPDPIDTAHLVGLLLMWGGSDEHSAERAKRAVREVMYVAQSSLTDADRAEIARGVLGEQA